MLLKIFGNSFVAIHKSKIALKLNKPVHIGTYILELSEILRYEFPNDYIQNKYDKKSKLLFTENDTLIYEIKIEDVSEYLSSNEKYLI